MNILIVEDDIIMVNLLMKMLSIKDKFNFFHAKDGMTCLEMIPTIKPDLIILDIEMPGIDGYKTCKKIRQIEKNNKNNEWIPVIFLTSRNKTKDIVKGIQSGGDDYICKPVNNEILKAKIKAMLRILRIKTKLEKKTKELEETNQKLDEFYKKIIPDKKEAEYKLTHDLVTGLPNSSIIKDRISQAIKRARIEYKMAAVLLIYINDFEEINEQQGTEKTDQLLISFSKSLNHCLHELSSIGKLSGSSFLVLIPEVDNEDIIAQIGQGLVRNLIPCVDILNLEKPLTFNIGISMYPNDGITTDELISSANIATCYAKKIEPNSFQFYHKKINHDTKIRQLLVNDIKNALHTSEFVLAFQPQVNFKTNKPRGVEVLIRWPHPKKGLISPAEFIPIAEETGFIHLIDNWMLEKACQQYNLNTYYKDNNILLSVNTSPIEILKPGFANTFNSIVNKNNISPSCIEIEITETMFTNNMDTLQGIIKELKKDGFKIAIDDFGTGYSSMSYIANLEIDAVKIDKSFIEQIAFNPKHKTIVQYIITMCKDLNLTVISEGIETIEQANILNELGCNCMQGYFFAKPEREEQIISTLKKMSSDINKNSG